MVPANISPEQVLEIIDHGMSLDEWAAYLLENNRREYSEPSLLPGPQRAMKREAIVKVYCDRETEGKQLWNDEDSWRKDKRFAALAVSVHRGRNGTVEEDGVVTTRSATG